MLNHSKKIHHYVEVTGLKYFLTLSRPVMVNKMPYTSTLYDTSVRDGEKNKGVS